MKKYFGLFLIFSLTACVKQPNVHNHYSPKKQTQTQFSLLDFLFSNNKNTSYKSPNSYTIKGRTYKTLKSSAGYRERGTATWYGRNFHNQRTSSGEHYNMYDMTAAHRTLPLHTYVRVTNLKNKRSVVVRINDRGPFHSNRLIDLSYAAARGIGLLPAGMTEVEVQTTAPQKRQRPSKKTVVKKASKRTVHHTTSAKKRSQHANQPARKKIQKKNTQREISVKKHTSVIKKPQRHVTHHATQIKKRQPQVVKVPNH